MATPGTQDVIVEFGAKVDKLNQGVEQVRGQLGTLNQSVAQISAGFENVANRIKQALSVGAIIAFAEKMAESGMQTQRFAAMLGVTGDQMLGLSAIAKMTGTDMESMVAAIERISLGVQRSTRDAFSPQAQALKVLGLSARDLIGLPADQYFNKLADAVSKFNPSLNLTNALMQLGGRGVTQMLPALLQGRAAFEQFRQAIERTKVGTHGFSEQASSTYQLLQVMHAAIGGFGKQLFLEFKPAIDAVITGLTNFVLWVRNSITESGSLSWVLDILKLGAKTLATAFVSAVAAVSAFGEAIGALIKSALAADMTEAENIIKNAEKNIVTTGKALKEELQKIWSANVEVRPKLTGRTDANAIQEDARRQLEALTRNIETEMDRQRALFERRKVLYDTDAALWSTTEQTKIARTIDATRQRIAAEVAAQEKIVEMWKVDPQRYAEEQRKLIKIKEDAMTELVRLNSESLKQQQQQWADFTMTVKGAFDNQIRGLLAGTVTWQQAWKNILGDMIVEFIKFITKMVAQWLAGQLARLTATQAVEAQIAAASAAGPLTTLPERIAKFTSDITSDAAAAFAGVFAFMSPLMGPAAAEPAAAASATVLAQLANVPKFELGTDYVPYTGLAMVHQGERIIPADQNKMAQAQPVGDTHNWTIKALDASSVRTLLMEHGEVLTRIVAGKVRSNPSMRPGY